MTIPRMLRGIGEELTQHGLQMVLFAPQSNADMDRLEQYLVGGHVDAVLLLALDEAHPLVGRLQSRGIPIVFAGKPRNGLAASFVHVDNHTAGRIATEHLIEQGRRRIAHLAGPAGDAAARERLQGYREAMWNAALRSDLVEHGELERDGGELAMHRLLAQTYEIDGVFAASDAMAAGAMWALQVVGFSVPHDVAVIGFDDSPLATATQPALSSVRQPIEEMGRAMTRLAIAPDRTPQRVTLNAELAIRDSTIAVRDQTGPLPSLNITAAL